MPEPAPPPAPPRLLTVGIATYDDFDGLYFTIQAIRMFHPEVADEIDFLVIDNHPDGPQGDRIRNLRRWIPNLRYVPCPRPQSTAVRDLLFRETTSEFVLCVDSHVLLVAGALAELVAYLRAHRDTTDLLQGPLLYDDLKSIATHCVPGWFGGMYGGAWAGDARAIMPGAPFEISLHGLGVLACRQAFSSRGPPPRSPASPAGQ
jgi:hypothetical protein